MLCFYKNTYTVFNAVDRSDLDTVLNWYPKKIFSCGADPLPVHHVFELLKTMKPEEVFNELMNKSESEESSAYETESEESEDSDYTSDEDDPISEQEESAEEQSEDENDFTESPKKRRKI